jgi:hypothetical protein
MPIDPKVRASAGALFAALALALTLAACGSQASSVLPGSGPLVTVTIHGGLCAAVPCDQSVILDPDGHVHAGVKPPNDLGQVPADVMAMLTAAIARTDFAALRSHPFTGQCPVAVDGQELIFEFEVGGATQRIASCDVDIDWGNPLFVALAAALSQWVPMPLT